MLLIQNGTVLTPFQRITSGMILLDGRKISAVEEQGKLPVPIGAEILDASGLFIVPGFIDLQINGGFGFDFTQDPTSIWKVASMLPRYGVTSFLPTIITSPLATVRTAQEVFLQGPPEGFSGTRPLGLHLEGPFLNPLKKGAHNPSFLRSPDVDQIADWVVEKGVRLVTLAPELPGAIELIRRLRERKVIVSAGHSMASYEEAQAGFDVGVKYGTHIFNAMPPLDHRKPGLAGALLENGQVMVGAIVDLIHVHPAIISMLWKTLGEQRLTLVTDAMGALGMAPGEYNIGDFKVLVDGNSARLEDGTLAGSILSSDQALRNLIAITGCSLDQAVQTLTSTPAKLLGENIGQIATGFEADLALLDKELNVKGTIIGGKIDWKSEPSLLN